MNKNAVIKRAKIIANRRLTQGEIFSLHRLCKEFTYEKVYVSLLTVPVKDGKFYYQLKEMLEKERIIKDTKVNIDVIKGSHRFSDADTVENNKLIT